MTTNEHDMLEKMLEALDFPVYTFDKDRTVLVANKAARDGLQLVPGSRIGTAEEGHFKYHTYFDEEGKPLNYPSGNPSVIERALAGETVKNLVLEHHNSKDQTHQWLQISCEPVLDEKGEFQYGIMSYQDISAQKNRDNKLKFLTRAQEVLSITEDFKKRLQEKAKLLVPLLADWCSIDIVTESGIERVALVHRDESKRAWLEEHDRGIVRPKSGIPAHRAIETGEALFAPTLDYADTEKDSGMQPEEWKMVKHLGMSSFMALPIRTKDKVLGAMSLGYAESGRIYTEEDMTFFQEFCHHLSVLLENARLYTQIHTRDAAKDVFLASLSHELRNPLAPIKSALEFIRLKNTDAELSGDIGVIEHQFDHMARLLNDLLDTTRFITGKIKLDTEPVEITQVVRSVVKALEPIARGSGIDIKESYVEKDVLVWADRTRIEQAISNIMNNAIKFSEPGSRISASVSLNGDEAEIKITDTGAGITAEEMEHIFEPYYQGDRVRFGNSGLGVGLRLVHEILRLHHGSVEARSEGSGKGSEFTITLPLMTADLPKDIKNHSGETTEKSGSVLVVDDNRAATDALTRLLKALGWDAHGLYSGKEALEYMEHNTVGTIFLDVGMPEMNGYETVRELRAKGHSLPIFALTGYGLEEDRSRAKDAGFTAHLTKPIGSRELHEVLGTTAQ